jgi:hypothetical protein
MRQYREIPKAASPPQKLAAREARTFEAKPQSPAPENPAKPNPAEPNPVNPAFPKMQRIFDFNRG